MNREQFHKLQKGDVLFYNGYPFTIDSVELGWDSEIEFEAPHTLTNDLGQTIKIGDPWLDEVQIIQAAYKNKQLANPLYLKRLEYVVAGIDEGIKAWDFIDEAVEELIEQYGGYIVDIDG